MFLVIGDIHGQLGALQTLVDHFTKIHSDIKNIILVGDIGENILPRKGSGWPITKTRIKRYFDSVRNVLEILKDYNVYFIHGNHDYPLNTLGTVSNHHYIHGKTLEVGNNVLIGWGGTKEQFGWPGEWEDRELDVRKNISTLISEAPENKRKIFIAHCPMYQYLDKTLVSKENAGCQILRELTENKVDIYLSGHIHEGYGLTASKKTIIGNAGSVAPPYSTLGYILIGEGEISYINLNNPEFTRHLPLQ